MKETIHFIKDLTTKVNGWYQHYTLPL